jgi:hypothetical protein
MKNGSISVPSFPQDGGCACGAIRYRLSEDPLGLHVCHCRDCQQVTGSAFVMTMPIHVRSLEVLRGEPAPFPFISPDGLSKCCLRCRDCGSRLWGQIGDAPALLALQPGTLDDTTWLQPVAHIWTSRKQPWFKISKDVLVFEKQPEDSLQMVRAWKERDKPGDRTYKPRSGSGSE